MSDKSPDAFRTISEVADWLGVQPHVLRFWESKFSQVRPVKRAGGRRYYRPNDMLLLGGLRKLLHEDGLTIKGAQKVLREEGVSHVARMSQPLDAESAALSDMTEFADMGGDDARDKAPAASPATPPEPSQPEPVAAPREADPDPVVPPSKEPEPAPRPELSGRPAPTPQDTTPTQKPDPTPEPPPVESKPAPTPEPDRAPDPKPAPVPSFMRNRATPKPPEAKPSKPVSEQTSDERLPSFLRPPEPAPTDPVPPEKTRNAEMEGEAQLPFDLPETSGTPEQAAPAQPKPKIVDAPDPDESSFQISGGALSAAFATVSLSSQRRAELLPLVAQLAALRDRMAAGRGR